MATVSDLFTVTPGHSLELNSLRACDPRHGIAFVSRRGGNNGVAAYVREIPGVPPAAGGQMTCALSGNPMATFLQDRPFYTAFHVACLAPRVRMSRQLQLYYCTCLRENRYRYNYGRQANRTLGSIVLPDPADVPSWVSTAELDLYRGISRPSSGVPVRLPPTCSWGAFTLGVLFDIKKGKRLTKAKMRVGRTPFLGAIDNNNGLVSFIDRPPIHEGNTITVNYNGNGVAVAFYQPTPYWCSDDVNVLYPRFALTPAAGLFVATTIRLERYRFNYGRKWHLERMRSASIRLPRTGRGEPDWNLVERFVKTLPYSSQLAN